MLWKYISSEVGVISLGLYTITLLKKILVDKIIVNLDTARGTKKGSRMIRLSSSAGGERMPDILGRYINIYVNLWGLDRWYSVDVSKHVSKLYLKSIVKYIVK